MKNVITESGKLRLSGIFGYSIFFYVKSVNLLFYMKRIDYLCSGKAPGRQRKHIQKNEHP